ncbi:MAG: ATP-binding domain-containing protein, partial [Pseudomonadota bacterium]|nr:ATP-binding domain-containing protein [Pseudomonadota bacterium]
NRLGKNLWTQKGAGEPIKLHAAQNDIEEAQHIVNQVRNLKRQGLSFSEMALLYRANAQSRILEHTLFNANVPYRVYGGLRFFERAEIKHALAYLRLSAGIFDDNAVLRVINFPTRGIGAKTIEMLQDAAQIHNYPLMEAIRKNLVAGKAGQALNHFSELIDRLQLKISGLVLSEAIERVIAESSLYSFYENEREGQDQLDNLNELINAASLFQTESDTPTIHSFLAHASLEAGDYQTSSTHSDSVQLMTIHAAKGLEFDTVFVSGLEEGLFPHDHSLHEKTALEEERRLMYVAMTRARQRLYLSYAQNRMLNNQRRYGIRSRFLDEIPEALIQLTSVHQSLQHSGTRIAESAVFPSANKEWTIGQNVIHP